MTARRCLAAAILSAAVVGCSASVTPPSLDVSALTDTNPAPDVVEVDLVAGQGTVRYLADGDAEVWGYRDGAVGGSKVSVPGPVLDVREGQQVIVHFKNELPEGTTIHWHGLRVPNASDGTPSVQAEVPSGGEFVYRFTASGAGTFWYHPHVRGDTQVERGLYGMVVVRGGVDIPVDADRAFALDDVKLEATGKLSTETTPLDVMLGRQGNVVVANGVRRGTVTARAGARERWRFVNTANGRYFDLRVAGRSFKVIGWDGGLLASPYDADTLLIAPGERYEVLVELPPVDGREIVVETVHYDRGHDIPDPGPIAVFTVQLAGSAVPMGQVPNALAPPLDLVPPSAAVERTIVLSEEEMAVGGFPKFFINGKSTADVPPVEAKVGDVEIWRVQNDSEMDHPFHLHGMFFRVLDVDGVTPTHDGWKDTVNIPKKKALRFVVQYGDAGTWMYHCHILEHAERGMMAELKLGV